jgi:hypothetical protein
MVSWPSYASLAMAQRLLTQRNEAVAQVRDLEASKGHASNRRDLKM